MTERVEEVSDERLDEMASYVEKVAKTLPQDYGWDEFAACLRELQEFRAQRRRQMQEG